MDVNSQLGNVFADSMLEIISVMAGFYHEVLSEERDDDFDELEDLEDLDEIDELDELSETESMINDFDNELNDILLED